MKFLGGLIAGIVVGAVGVTTAALITSKRSLGSILSGKALFKSEDEVNETDKKYDTRKGFSTKH